MFSPPCREVVAVLLSGVFGVVVGLPIAGAAQEKPLSPETILAKKFEGKATVEFLVGEVRTLNIDSLFVPGVSHAQIIKAKVLGAKDGQEVVVIVSREIATRPLQLEIDDPAEHLRGKVLRGAGRVERRSETQYQIRVTSPDQLETIRKKQLSR